MNEPVYTKSMDSLIFLTRPHVECFESFLNFIRAMKNNDEGVWHFYLPYENESPENFIQRLNLRESQPEPPLVPESSFWAIFENKVVGRISIRHRLEGNLKLFGGHIGYEVHPSFRQRGFAKEMLKQAIQTSKAKEIKKLLLTCSPENTASIKTILANGGILEKTVYVESVKRMTNHYWINLE